MEANDKPFPIRLGELKPILQMEATQMDRSLHWLIKRILKDYTESRKEKVSKSGFTDYSSVPVTLGTKP